MGMEEYGRTLTHSVLSGVVRKFEPDPNMLGRKIFTPKPAYSRTVGIDVVVNPRHMASYRHPEAPAGKQARKVIQHLDITPPSINESISLSAAALNALREPGTEHQRWGKGMVKEHLQALDIIIENRREWARFQVLQTGVLANTAAHVDEISFSIDFGMLSAHKPALSGTARWSEASTCDPVGNITDWKKTFAQNTGKVPKYGLLGTTQMGYLRNSAAVRALMGDRMKDDVFLLGRLRETCELELTVYDAGYVPLGGSFTPFLGEDKFLMWTGDTYPEHEAIFDDLAATTPGKFSKTYEEQNPSGIVLMSGVCSIPSGERANELFCATITAGS